MFGYVVKFQAMAKASEEIERANANAARARAQANNAKDEAEQLKKQHRQQKRQDEADTYHVLVRVGAEGLGTLGLAGGIFVGARYLGGRRIFESIPFTWNALGGVVGVVGKIGAVGLEDTPWELLVAPVAEFGKGLGGSDIAIKGLEMRAKAAQEATKKGK